MITFCIYTPDFQPLYDLVGPVWKEYCERHGSEMVFLCEDKIGQFAQFHYSYYKIQRALENYQQRRPDGMWVVDLDILPTNLGINPAAYLSANHAITITRDINGLNSGSFFLNGFWTTKVELWLKSVVALRHHTTSEQHAMHVLQEAYDPETFFYAQPSFNSICYHDYPDFGGRHNDDPGCWKPGHPVAHWPGMTLQQRLDLIPKYLPLIVR